MRRSLYKKMLPLCLLTVLLLRLSVFAAAAAAEWPLPAVWWTDRYDGGGMRIAVIDTGISLKHLEAARVLAGKNYVFPECGTEDLVGHGTHVAGIILGSESMGLRGVAPGAALVPLVYYSQYPSGVPLNGGTEALCKAIYDAVDVYGCGIINISAGLPYDDGGLKAAAAYAEERGVLIVSAVGNDNLTSSGRVYYPAAYDTVVGVGAAGADGQAAPSSQRNSSVMLLAPGAHIPAVTNSNAQTPEIVSGSSYAAAYVTGAAALLLQCSPNLTPAQLRGILRDSAADVGAAG